MSDLKATVVETPNGFHVEGYEKIEYDFTFLDGVFNIANPQLARCYERWGRCLAIMDMNIFKLYGTSMRQYFEHYGLDLKIHKTMIGEKAKSLDTFLEIVDSMTEFGIIRKEPVLVVVCRVVIAGKKGSDLFDRVEDWSLMSPGRIHPSSLRIPRIFSQSC
jgi:3-dehydroquinate synthase